MLSGDRRQSNKQQQKSTIKETYIHKWKEEESKTTTKTKQKDRKEKRKKGLKGGWVEGGSVNAASQLRTDEFSGVCERLTRKYILSVCRKAFWRTCCLFFHNFSFHSEFKNRFSHSHKGNFHKFSTVVTAVLLTIKR